MEGKAVLFKKFAGIDCFDIEINERDPDKLVDIIVALEPTFGGINLEDIKAPECFAIEKQCRERMKIPGVPRRSAWHGDHRRGGGAQRLARRRQGHGQDQARGVGCGRGRARLPRPARRARRAARERVGLGHQGRGLAGSRRGDGREQGALRAADEGALAARDSRRRRRVPRTVGRARAQARVARENGTASADPRAREPGAGDHAGPREGRTAGRDHRDRSFRLSEPGQQRPLLPVHLSRRARCRGDADQRADEACRSARDRRPGDGRAVGDRGQCVQRAGPEVRSRLPDPEAVRSALDRHDRAGRGESRDGFGCRDAAARRPRCLSRPVDDVRLPLRPVDEADLPGREEVAEANRVRGRRGRARAARGADRRRRGARVSAARGSTGRAGGSHREIRAASQGRRRFRGDQSRTTTRATANTGPSTTASPRARACRSRTRRSRCAAATR